MTPSTATGDVPARPVRADARRNREAILAAADEAFARHGTDVALETVARTAGVGIATLYRNFPDREALVAGVYAREIDLLCDEVDAMLAEREPDVALEDWMRRFVGYVAGRAGMALALRAVVMSGDAPDCRSSNRRVHAAVRTLTDAAVSAGRLRTDVTAEDLVGAMTGLCLITGQPGWQDRARRLVTVLVDGMRHR